ncbi:glycoside hydrolase family 2 [Prauserella halophila]|uniref:Glycoside hydrolase family 2 n=1 Tax=Prauserella halophila TaxID=185641 RepID=A0ABN1VW25_9PSEU|nr:sugar-binding domain-containing protein [Prauserella halophila]MCP2234614.1 Glycosyl hydrolases family 2 [Prauserella halophila]
MNADVPPATGPEPASDSAAASDADSATAPDADSAAVPAADPTAAPVAPDAHALAAASAPTAPTAPVAPEAGCGSAGTAVTGPDGRPVAPLTTPWTADVDPDAPLPEHPRPHLTRGDRWRTLNGRWEYTAAGGDGEPQGREEIVVPFPPEAALSGIGRRVERMWYRRTFDVPADWRGGRVLLHFGAVDQIATVWVNHQLVARHEGGYTAFSVDLTEVLRADGASEGRGSGEQEIVVRAEDTGNSGTFPVGKQANRPGGILYTGASGIWQTVWLEAVPHTRIDRLDVTSDLTGVVVTAIPAGAEVATATGATAAGATAAGAAATGTAVVEVEVAGVTGTGAAERPVRVDVPSPRPWSPDDPHLYAVTVRLHASTGDLLDEVHSHVGLRTIGLVPDAEGRSRIALNGRITFLYGPLDQGYWPDGIYTAPTDAALRHDLEQAKAYGFNTVRKHVKVEPARWYHWADRLGLLVWQDIPSLPVVLDNPPGPQAPPVDRARTRFEEDLAGIVAALRSVTSLVVWTPFNEGWGEYDTARITEQLMAADPERLVVADSGVNCCHSHPDSGAGHVYDDHTYVGPGRPLATDHRATADGEYGGLGLAVGGHLWPGDPVAYEMTGSAEELTRRYVEVARELRTVVRERGLSAAIYTQATDVENEVNGLLTYDRRVHKVDLDAAAEANRAVLAEGAGADRPNADRQGADRQGAGGPAPDRQGAGGTGRGAAGSGGAGDVDAAAGSS